MAKVIPQESQSISCTPPNTLTNMSNIFSQYLFFLLLYTEVSGIKESAGIMHIPASPAQNAATSDSI
jgi:hypothetical protein